MLELFIYLFNQLLNVEDMFYSHVYMFRFRCVYVGLMPNRLLV